MENPPRRILILFAHPSLDRSAVNQPMMQASQGIENVTLVDLYADYPDFQIDIEREQQRLISHDVVIFQHPLYWYSTPAILKEWLDLVLEYGFAYGPDGDALHGKIFLNALSAGGMQTAYCADGYNRFSLRELLRPIEQTALLTGMTYLPPYALFGACAAANGQRISAHIDDWVKLLQALRDDTLNITAALNLPLLTGHLDALIKGAA